MARCVQIAPVGLHGVIPRLACRGIGVPWRSAAGMRCPMFALGDMVRREWILHEPFCAHAHTHARTRHNTTFLSSRHATVGARRRRSVCGCDQNTLVLLLLNGVVLSTHTRLTEAKPPLFLAPPCIAVAHFFTVPYPLIPSSALPPRRCRAGVATHRAVPRHHRNCTVGGNVHHAEPRDARAATAGRSKAVCYRRRFPRRPYHPRLARAKGGCGCHHGGVVKAAVCVHMPQLGERNFLVSSRKGLQAGARCSVSVHVMV
jgi:hypothetical protein